MQSIMDIKNEKLNKINKEIAELGTDMGWMDDNGTYAPLINEMMGTATVLEQKRLEVKNDVTKGLQYIQLVLARTKLEKEIADLKQI